MLSVMVEDANPESEFLAAFKEYSDSLFRHALFRLSDRERAYDVTQDAFMKTWDFVRKGGVVKHYKSFLYRTVNNLIIDEYRKKRPESLDMLLDEAPGIIEKEVKAGSVLEVELALDGAMLMDRVRDALHTLPDHYRAVVVMRFIEELQPKEIAEALGITENVASVRIHRGIAKLKKILNTP